LGERFTPLVKNGQVIDELLYKDGEFAIEFDA
jgi:hypothetical protein